MSPTVSLVRCADYAGDALLPALEHALSPFGGMAALARSGEHVVLKPNFVVARPAQAAVNTHPAFIAGVAKICLDHGARVTVADSPAVDTAQRVAERLGLLDLLKPLNVPVLDLADAPRVAHRLPHSRSTVKVSRIMLESDALINLPKIKVHTQVALTLAVKNLFGTVVARRKALLHGLLGHNALRFGTMLCEVAQLAAPRINLVDGIVILERNGPTSGDPRQLGLVAAGDEAIALDAVLIELLSYPPHEVPTQLAAQRHNLGTWDLDKIQLVGEDLEAMRITDLKRAFPLPISFSPLQLARGLVRYYRARWNRPKPATA